MVASRIFGSLFGGAPRGGNLTQGTSGGGAPAAPPDEDALLAAAIDQLLATVRGSGNKLPGIVSSQLRQLDDLLHPLIDYIKAQGASTEQRVLLEAMVGDYISTPLTTYLLTSDADRQEDSRTTGLFAGQLAVLYSTARDLDHQVRSGAITELSTHARFLQDKFNTTALTLRDEGNRWPT